MKKEDIQALFQNFEDAVCTIDDTECWSARDMQKLLGYSLWQIFTNVINKAKAACENVGQPISDHFIDVNKKVDLGRPSPVPPEHQYDEGAHGDAADPSVGRLPANH